MLLIEHAALRVINTELARLGVKRKEVEIDVGYRCSRYLVEWADAHSPNPLFCVIRGADGQWEIE